MLKHKKQPAPRHDALNREVVVLTLVLNCLFVGIANQRCLHSVGISDLAQVHILHNESNQSVPGPFCTNFEIFQVGKKCPMLFNSFYENNMKTI